MLKLRKFFRRVGELVHALVGEERLHEGRVVPAHELLRARVVVRARPRRRAGLHVLLHVLVEEDGEPLLVEILGIVGLEERRIGLVDELHEVQELLPLLLGGGGLHLVVLAGHRLGQIDLGLEENGRQEPDHCPLLRDKG
jgi:hypothetical protein